MPEVVQVRMGDLERPLVPLDEVRAQLRTTEPLIVRAVPLGSEVRFELHPEWNVGGTALAAEAEVEAQLVLGKSEGTESIPLSAGAVVDAGRLAGLSRRYVLRTPGSLVAPHLNYWFRQGLEERRVGLLTVDKIGQAFARSSVAPMSVVELLDHVVAGLRARFGSDMEVYADPKLVHSVRETYLRLVVPAQYADLAPDGGESDPWSLGLQLQTSLTGAHPTRLLGLVFRWWCANGAVDVAASAGWSRRGSRSADEVYAWAGDAVAAVLRGLDSTMQQVKALTGEQIDGQVTPVLRDVFDHYRLPAVLIERVLERVLEPERMTAYLLMQAITGAANDPDLTSAQVDKLMRVGGDFPRHFANRCEACSRVRLV